MFVVWEVSGQTEGWWCKSQILSCKFGVWILSTQTIFLPDIVMPLFHFCPPFFLLGFHLIGLFLHFGFEPLGSEVLTLAAAEQANQKGDDDDSSDHCQGDYQRLEVHPAEAPACIVQRTEWMGWKDGPHWVCNTRLGGDAPETRHIFQTFLTACPILRLAHVVRCCRLGENRRQTEDKQQSSDNNPWIHHHTARTQIIPNVIPQTFRLKRFETPVSTETGNVWAAETREVNLPDRKSVV